MPRRNGTRSVRRSVASDVRSTGSARWLSTVTDPCPGKCLRAPIVPASAMPRSAATTWAAATAGKPEAERVPITGSAGPRVTSATGASTEVKPRPRISRAPARAARRVSCGSRAAPVDMNDGKRVAASRIRTTVPPSWSTPMNAGYPRPRTARWTDAFTAAIWALEVMFSATGTTPPRCSRRTMAAGDPVPR